MPLNEQDVVKILSENQYATMVTIARSKLASRTITYGFVPEQGAFILTHKHTVKMNDLDYSKKGLLHLAKIDEEVENSYDISVNGWFEKIGEESTLYSFGFETLAQKNPMVMDLLHSDAKAEYQLLLFHPYEIVGNDYMQAINAMPKTTIMY